MKAKLLRALRHGNKSLAPLAGKVTLVDLDKKEFDRLEAMGKVAKPTDDDLKIGRLVNLGTGVVNAEPKAEPMVEDKGDGSEDEALAAARAEFESLFGKGPGNMKLETIQGKIAEKKAADGGSSNSGSTETGSTEGGNNGNDALDL